MVTITHGVAKNRVTVSVQKNKRLAVRALARGLNPVCTSSSKGRTEMREKPSYPELREKVWPIVQLACQEIEMAANSTESKMPYKSQFILECVVEELKSRI
jgi:hypothetical protein